MVVRRSGFPGLLLRHLVLLQLRTVVRQSASKHTLDVECVVDEYGSH